MLPFPFHRWSLPQSLHDCCTVATPFPSLKSTVAIIDTAALSCLSLHSCCNNNRNDGDGLLCCCHHPLHLSLVECCILFALIIAAMLINIIKKIFPYDVVVFYISATRTLHKSYCQIKRIKSIKNSVVTKLVPFLKCYLSWYRTQKIYCLVDCIISSYWHFSIFLWYKSM